MWILLRLIGMAMGFVLRYASRFRKRSDDNRLQGVAYSEQTSRKGRRIIRTELSVPMDTGVVFVLTEEGFWDRLFKGVGLTEEFQTGDASFDWQVYVGSDHPNFFRFLKGDQASRDAFAALFDGGFHRVWSDGRRLYAISNKAQPATEWVPQLARLKTAIERAGLGGLRRTPDPFAWRVLLVEALLWSLTGYAVAGFVEMDLKPSLVPSRVEFWGLGVSVLAFGAVLALVVLFLQRSSRSHRVLVESAILLLFSLPVLGIQAIVDVNQRLDRAPPLTVEIAVERTWIEVHRSRRLGKHNEYFAQVRTHGEIAIPSPMSLSQAVYQSLIPGKTVKAQVGPGRLGFPYYIQINGVPQ